MLSHGIKGNRTEMDRNGQKWQKMEAIGLSLFLAIFLLFHTSPIKIDFLPLWFPLVAEEPEASLTLSIAKYGSQAPLTGSNTFVSLLISNPVHQKLLYRHLFLP